MVEEVMLQESFDLPSTQILSLHAMGSYLAGKPQLTVSESATTAAVVTHPAHLVCSLILMNQVSEERALGASLLICGQKQDNSVGLSAQLLGNALLGACLCFCLHSVCLSDPFCSYSPSSSSFPVQVRWRC